MTLPPPTLLRALAAAGTGLIASLIAGCASTPSGLSTNNLRQLQISMTVAGFINPADFYFVVFNTSNNLSASVGPIPPIAPDWGGNGFVTGSATQYVEFNNSVGGLGYGLGEFNTSGGNLQAQGANSGLIANAQAVTTGSNTLQFTIPLSELEPTGSNETITAIQMNFINTNTITPGNIVPLATPKLFDALGNTLVTTTTFITIPTTQDGTYNNSTISGTASEPTSQDVAATYGTGAPPGATTDPDAPNLDIVNWSVTVAD